MRIRSLITTALGVAIAGASVFVAKEQFLEPNVAAIASATPVYSMVAVANRDIQFGQPIEAHLVEMKRWPSEALPEQSFQSIDALVAARGGEPRRAKARLFAGEVIMENKLSGFGEKVTIVQKLGENTRAMAIKVDAVTAVGGFVTPGDFVDIVMTQGRNESLSAVTILQNIRVIGVDQTSEERNDQPEIARTVTVEVSPDQGQRLALAQKAGTLSLTLRTLDQVMDKPLAMVRLSDLLTEESPIEEPEEIPRTVTVRRGNAAVEIVPVN